jgi:antitoxin component of RelBE/YafQ-DinJ toxin-antitoxin module
MAATQILTIRLSVKTVKRAHIVAARRGMSISALEALHRR